MRYLVDTHVLIFTITNDIKSLGSKLYNIMTQPDAEYYVSIVSYWEIAIKESLGKLNIHNNLSNKITNSGFKWLHVTPKHIDMILKLPHHHRDPFDRLLIAQSKVTSMPLLTLDRKIMKYF